MRRRLLLPWFLLWTADILLAQSHPGWWTYASPDATALVGLDWHALRTSPFADALRQELGAGGLGLPALDSLDQAAQILISSPPLLIVASGSFPSAVAGREASAQGFRLSAYKNVTLWIAPQPGLLSVALLSPQLVLVGSRKTLEASIDRATDLAAQESETARASVRKYSPLLAHAAQFAHNADLWVVSSRLPDPLASRFVPLETEARAFEGGVSVQNGLRLEALLSASSNEGGLVMAEHLRGEFAALTPLARAIEIRVDGDQIELSLTVPLEQFNASLRNAPSPKPLPPPEIPKETKPKQPQVIRITGLDTGPVEIPFPDPPEVKN